jgi:hypothetical protein
LNGAILSLWLATPQTQNSVLRFPPWEVRVPSTGRGRTRIGRHHTVSLLTTRLIGRITIR